MTARTCWSLFRLKAREGFQYRMAGLAGAATSIFWVSIEIAVFTVFYTHASNQDAGTLAGLTLSQVICYLWLGQLMYLMQPMSIDSEILSKIDSGDVGIELCRPLDLYQHWFTKTAAARLTPLFWRGSAVLLAAVVTPAPYGLSLPPSFAALLWALVSCISALFLCTAYGTLVCAVRLHIPWGDGPTYMLMLTSGVLSGVYLPLQLWPDFLQTFLLWQPFAGYLDLPLRIYVGSMAIDSAMWAVGLQWIWVIVFTVIGKAIMARRLQSLVVQGG